MSYGVLKENLIKAFYEGDVESVKTGISKYKEVYQPKYSIPACYILYEFYNVMPEHATELRTFVIETCISDLNLRRYARFYDPMLGCWIREVTHEMLESDTMTVSSSSR